MATCGLDFMHLNRDAWPPVGQLDQTLVCTSATLPVLWSTCPNIVSFQRQKYTHQVAEQVVSRFWNFLLRKIATTNIKRVRRRHYDITEYIVCTYMCIHICVHKEDRFHNATFYEIPTHKCRQIRSCFEEFHCYYCGILSVSQIFAADLSIVLVILFSHQSTVFGLSVYDSACFEIRYVEKRSTWSMSVILLGQNRFLGSVGVLKGHTRWPLITGEDLLYLILDTVFKIYWQFPLFYILNVFVEINFI